MRYTLFIIALIGVLNCFSQEKKKNKPAEQSYQVSEEMQYVYPRPKFFGWLTGLPRNYANLGKGIVKKENVKWLGLTAASTVLLLQVDESMLESAQNLQNLGIEENHKHGDILGTIPYPKNTSAAMYYLGHGNTSLIIGSGFLVVGALKKDYRALHVSSEIVEGILTLGFRTQVLKRVFGRESPYVSTQPGGRWDFFPNLSEYDQNKPHYDAMPSGHVATLTSTVTILAKNYPEVKWIRPVGYTLIGILGVEMMNSGVHWASDYPLGFLIGYTVGTVVTNSKITKVKTEKYSHKSTGFNTNLTYNRHYGDNLVGIRVTF
jgi:membrane-associated phospholipid phosphatase